MLDIDIYSKNGILFVRLFGKLNNTTRQKMNKEVISLIHEVGIKNVVINIQNLKELDKVGIKELEKCFKITEKCLLCINLNQKEIINNMIYVTDEKEALNLIKV